MVNLLIADDHAVVRAGVKQLAAASGEIGEIGEAATGREALARLREAKWDVVLLDISLPDLSGIEVLKEIKREWPDLPVLVFTIHSEEQYAIRALRAGAAGYLCKSAPPREFMEAVLKVAAGGKYASPALAERLVTRLSTEHHESPHELLSDREYQVLCMIASGKTVTEIAEELSLSPKTISTYRLRILEKMHMKHSAELTRYAVERGLTA
jgi:DNA-binding NarL/FixJ family response regulator